MAERVVKDGLILEVQPDGTGVVVGYADAPAPQGRVFTLPQSPKEQRQEARQSEADARAAAADARAAEAAERAAREWNATHNPDGSPKNKSGNKPMRQGDADHLEEQINAYSYLKEAVGSFDDNYAGNTITGGLENTLQRKLGTGTPGQADWWANFKTADNLIRNKLFGASLTAGEKAAYAETTIDPSMDPKIIRQNLNRRAEIARDVLARRVQRLHSVYNPEEVEAALGEFKGDLLAGKAGQQADNEVPDPTTGADLKAPPADGSPPDMPPANGGDVTATDGKNRVTYDPRMSSQIDAMINAGASKGMIDAVLKRQSFPAVTPGEWSAIQTWRKQNPGKKYYGANISRSDDLNFGQRILANEYVAPVAAGAARYANAATAGTVGALAGEEGKGALDAAGALHPDASVFGDVAGGITGALGAEAAVAARAPAALARFAPAIADTLYGGALGFNTAREGEGAWEAAKGAGAGALGGVAGRAAFRGAGRVARGVRDPAVDFLQQRGIPTTVGQVLGQGGMIGRGIKKAEDALTSVPFVGNMIEARRMEGLREFNRAAFDTGAEQLAGANITDTGAQGIQQMRAAVGQAYDNALNPVRVDINEPQFIQDLQDVRSNIARIPNVNGARDAAAEGLTYRLDGAVDPNTNIMGGRGFQEAYRGLARTARERANGDYGHEVGQVMREGQDALAGLLQRQSPGSFEGFRAANATNRNTNVLAEAVNRAKNAEDEIFTPAQLNMADTQSARRLTGPLASAAGERPFYELANAGQQVLPSKLPESGTWTRLLVGGGLTGALGGGGAIVDGGEGAATGTGAGLGATLLLAAGGSRPAQRILVNALTRRSPTAIRVGDRLIENSGIGGWTGAGVLTPLLVGQ